MPHTQAHKKGDDSCNVQAAVRENGERADALQAQLDSERSGKSESLKTAESHRQSLALENQRLAFDMESLKQKEVCVRQLSLIHI